jgi:hypothetical protein
MIAGACDRLVYSPTDNLIVFQILSGGCINEFCFLIVVLDETCYM